MSDSSLFVRIIEVDKGQSPLRLDKFLVDRVQGASRSKLQAGILDGRITVSDKLVHPNYRVRPGDRICLTYLKANANEPMLPEPVPFDILYEDEQVLVVNKPPDVVVHPAHGHPRGTLLNGLARHFQYQPAASENLVRMGLVHRIDKDTSGILVVGKTEAAIAHLSAQFAAHSVHRRYWALVWGGVSQGGTIVMRVGRDPRYRQRFTAFDPASVQGKHAVTHYRVLENLSYVSLLECQLETGRTHQIRVHMQQAGQPIFADPVYGGRAILKGMRSKKYDSFVENCLQILPRQALHAKELGFVHPQTGQYTAFVSDLPNDFQTVLDRWRAYMCAKDTEGRSAKQ